MVNDATSTKRTFECEKINPDTYNNSEQVFDLAEKLVKEFLKGE